MQCRLSSTCIPENTSLSCFYAVRLIAEQFLNCCLTWLTVQVAGGSGLTPMLQVIKEIVRNPEDKTEVSFVFANQTVEDIILKPELDDLAAKHHNIQVMHLLLASHSSFVHSPT